MTTFPSLPFGLSPGTCRRCRSSVLIDEWTIQEIHQPACPVESAWHENLCPICRWPFDSSGHLAHRDEAAS